jgi:putative polymerase
MAYLANISDFFGFTAPRRAGLAGSAVPGKTLVFWILIVALMYQAVLCAVHTTVHPISMSGVAATEMVIYLGCFAVLIKNLRLEFIALVALTVAYLLLLAILRNQLDPKGFRDVLIPLLFYGIGRQIGDIKYADRVLKVAVLLVLAFGFFELLFLDAFSRVFNIFSYYVSQGSLQAGSNWAKDSVLGLNGTRPEGIGRTILPSLLGNHRVSSVFLEPVSLGNFAVITAAWGLAKRREDFRDMAFFVGAALIMIALADSRYGMITLTLLVAVRLLPWHRNAWMIVLPLASVGLLLGIGNFYTGGYGDNVIGRLYVSGVTLMDLNLGSIFGLDGFNVAYGDMGYPTLLTRWGALLCIFLWCAFWMVRMEDERGDRFRAFTTLYMSLILCVSGTSLFALKTAGILWFLVGCFAGRPPGLAGSTKKEAPNVH